MLQVWRWTATRMQRWSTPAEPAQVDSNSDDDDTDNHSDAEIDSSLAESFTLLGHSF
jgi:hypothetical protein